MRRSPATGATATPAAYHRVTPASDPLTARTSGPGDAIVHPYLTTLNHSGDDGRSLDPASGPLPTRSTKVGEAVVTPYMIQRRDYDGPDAPRISGIGEPMPTRTASDRGIHGLVVPGQFISHQYGAVKGSEHRNSDPATTPLGTITAGGAHHNLVTPPIGITLRNNSTPYRVDENPTATIAAGGGHHGIATLEGAFLSKHHGGLEYRAIGHMNKPLTDPMPTVVGKTNVSLVTPTKRPKITATAAEIDAVDIRDFRFRMLQWREHATAQRFPRDYIFKGNSSVNTLHAGNAVAANVACYLGYACRIALGDLTPARAGFEWLEDAA